MDEAHQNSITGILRLKNGLNSELRLQITKREFSVPRILDHRFTGAQRRVVGPFSYALA